MIIHVFWFNFQWVGPQSGQGFLTQETEIRMHEFMKVLSLHITEVQRKMQHRTNQMEMQMKLELMLHLNQLLEGRLGRVFSSSYWHLLFFAHYQLLYRIWWVIFEFENILTSFKRNLIIMTNRKYTTWSSRQLN